MGVYREAKINQLLQLAQKGGLFFSSWLHDQGYSPQLLMRYRKSGWLSALSKGVFYRKGESLSALGALASYQSQVSSDLYVAAHSALELWGFNHYVPMGKPVLMVGMRQRSVPLWLNPLCLIVISDHFIRRYFQSVSPCFIPISRLATPSIDPRTGFYRVSVFSSQAI